MGGLRFDNRGNKTFKLKTALYNLLGILLHNLFFQMYDRKVFDKMYVTILYLTFLISLGPNCRSTKYIILTLDTFVFLKI